MYVTRPTWKRLGTWTLRSQTRGLMTQIQVRQKCKIFCVRQQKYWTAGRKTKNLPKQVTSITTINIAYHSCVDWQRAQIVSTLQKAISVSRISLPPFAQGSPLPLVSRVMQYEISSTEFIKMLLNYREAVNLMSLSEQFPMYFFPYPCLWTIFGWE